MDNDAVERLIAEARCRAGPPPVLSGVRDSLLDLADAAEAQRKQEREALENFEAVKRNRDGLMRRYGECQEDVTKLIQLNAQKDADLAEERERVGRLQRALAHRLAYTAGEIRSLEREREEQKQAERVVEVIVATTPRNGMEEVHMLVFHKPGGQCLGVPVTNWPGFSHAWSLAKILGLPSSAGCYHLALHRLEPEPEKPKVRPWRLKTGTIICPLCHEILKRSCGDDPNILPPCFGCEASFGEPRELAVSDG